MLDLRGSENDSVITITVLTLTLDQKLPELVSDASNSGQRRPDCQLDGTACGCMVICPAH